MGKIFVLEMREDAFTIKKSAGMKPSGGFDWRLVKRLVISDKGTVGIALGKIAIRFHIDLFNATKAAKLAFYTVEITVVVGIAAGETGLPPFVGNGDSFDTMDGERQFGDPGFSGKLVIQIKFGRGSILNARFRPYQILF